MTDLIMAGFAVAGGVMLIVACVVWIPRIRPYDPDDNEPPPER